MNEKQERNSPHVNHTHIPQVWTTCLLVGEGPGDQLGKNPRSCTWRVSWDWFRT